MPITTLTLSGEFYTIEEKLPEEGEHVRAVTDGVEIEQCIFTRGEFAEYDEGWVVHNVLLWSYDVTIKEE